MGRRLTVTVLLFAVWPIAGISTAFAATCSVPSASHTAVQAAVDDVACTVIQLAAGTFSESVVIGRGLTLRGDAGGGTTIVGQVLAQAGMLQISDLTIDGPGDAYSHALGSSNGAEINALNVVVRNGVADAVLFADGFETGDTTVWTSVAPGTGGRS